MGRLHGHHGRSEGQPADVAHLGDADRRKSSGDGGDAGYRFVEFTALVAGRTISGVSFGSRSGASADLAAFDERRRGTAAHESRKRRVEFRMVARIRRVCLCLTRTGPPPSKNSDVRHYTHINYKFNDTGWFDERRSHVEVIDAKTGAAKQITDRHDWNDRIRTGRPIRRGSRSCRIALGTNSIRIITAMCG